MKLHAAILALLAIHAAPVTVQAAPAAEPSAVASPAIADPPRDPAHPARNRQLVIPSGPVVPALGRPAEMNALFLLAAGEGPKPTMILLHGLPGNERNLDLAQAVRRAGWNVLTFTYRGAWGSEGTFSIQHAIEDARAALAFLRSPAAARDFAVDPARIVIAGHSMGGGIGALVAAEDPALAGSRPAAPPLAGLVLLDAWNIGATAPVLRAAGADGRAGFIAAFDDIGHALGPVTAGDLADELVRRGDAWELAARAPALARLPILTVSASDGNAAEIRALAGTIRAAPGARVDVVELETDHSFADKRVTLAQQVIAWLEELERR
jgi:pimeloyl-ACP methyl ester carboxylesterase